VLRYTFVRLLQAILVLWVVATVVFLLSRASGSIGRTLDIRHTAGELAELVVPEFAEAVIVDIFEPVLGGEEPQHFGTHPTLCRVAHRTDHTAAKDTAYDELDTVSLRCLAENAPATDAATHVLALPLKARGTTLGEALRNQWGSLLPARHARVDGCSTSDRRTARDGFAGAGGSTSSY